MKTNRHTQSTYKPQSKPVAQLDASLLARKGEAVPSVRETVHNNPSLAWQSTPQEKPKTRPTLRLNPRSFATEEHDRQNTKGDVVAMTLKIEDESYLRLKYQSQVSGRSSQDLIRTALEFYLNSAGVPQGANWVLKPA